METNTKVSVTQKHIDAGTKLTCWSCPIARAVHDLFDLDVGDHVYVTHDWVKVTKHDHEKMVTETSYYDLPHSAMMFIHAFDETVSGYQHLVKPFEFHMYLNNYGALV